MVDQNCNFTCNTQTQLFLNLLSLKSATFACIQVTLMCIMQEIGKGFPNFSLSSCSILLSHIRARRSLALSVLYFGAVSLVNSIKCNVTAF